MAEIWQLLKRFPAKLKIRFFVMGMARQLEKLGVRLVRVGPQKSETMVVAQYGTAINDEWSLGSGRYRSGF